MKLKQRVQEILEDHGLVGPADRSDATDAIVTLMWNQFAEQAIATPFLDGGRSLAGWDCWGLVVCAYRDVLGISLPSYDDYDTVQNHKVLARLFTSKVPEWRKVPKATDGCVALIYRRGASDSRGGGGGEWYPDIALRTAHRVDLRAAGAV